MQAVVHLKEINKDNTEFAYSCLKELRGDVDYELEDFERYVEQNALVGNPEFMILIGEVDGNPVGLLTCNRFAVPRYLGFGYEIEEVVVHHAQRRKGYGQAMVCAFLERVKDDERVRKVIVKTDDGRVAGRLYDKMFTPSGAVVYQRSMHHL